MGWIQQQMNLDVNPEDILAYMIPHAQLVSQYYTRLFRVPYFSMRLYMSVVEFNGLLSSSLDASKTGESTKWQWVGRGGDCWLI